MVRPLEDRGLKVIAAPIPLTSLSDDAAALRRTIARTQGPVIVAGHARGVKTGLHTRTTGTLGDLYLTLSEEVLGARIEKFPTASRKLSEVV